MATYTPPSNDSVDFSIKSYSPPSNDATDFVTLSGDTSESFSRSVTSHVNAITSVSEGIIDLIVTPTSHVNSITSTNTSQVTFIRTPTSHVAAITSTADSIGIDLIREVTSHVGAVSSFAQNDRTSLELIDYDVVWDQAKSAWVTGWFPMTKILGNEDEYGIKAYTAPQATDPAARIRIEYDADGDETPDEVSDPVYITEDEQIEAVERIPLDEDGYYRIVIDQYSGYNDLVGLDVAFIR